jgi:hypothetical protein
MALTLKIRKLSEARARVATLEKDVLRDLSRELAKLPDAYGFDSVEEFISAIRAATNSVEKSMLRTNGLSSDAISGSEVGDPAGDISPIKRSRAIITGPIRTKVKRMTKAGYTGLEIAKAVGISLPSVQNIKKDFGLSKQRLTSRQKKDEQEQRPPLADPSSTA